MNSESVVLAENEFIMNTYARFPVIIARGEGATLYSNDRRELIDFTSGIGVCSIGHANPLWISAITRQASKLAHISNLYYTIPQVELAQKLCGIAGTERVFFSNSGAESNEGAIKLARKYSSDKYGPGRSTIITLKNSFHGRTVTTLAATGQDKFHKHFGPFTEGFRFAEADDVSSLEAAAGDDVCAVMMELIQGEGGVMPLDPAYVAAVEKLCRERDWLLIIDEVQTGVGRTGTWFAFQQYGIKPDVVTLAKGLAGGLPIGAVLASDSCAGVLDAGSHATTFGGNPLVCAAAAAVLDVLSAEIPSVMAKGEYITEEILKMRSKYVAGVRGRGLMLGVVIRGANPRDLVLRMIDAGVLCLTAGSDAIRLLPPLTITPQEIKKGMLAMEKVLRF